MILQADEPDKLQTIIDAINELTSDDKEELWTWFNSKTLVGGMIVDSPAEERVA